MFGKSYRLKPWFDKKCDQFCGAFEELRGQTKIGCRTVAPCKGRGIRAVETRGLQLTLRKVEVEIMGRGGRGFGEDVLC